MTQIEKYNYLLPERLIAKAPASPRDSSRLLVFDSANGIYSDEIFSNLGNYIGPGDLIITNNSKVIPARIFGHKKTGGKIELLLIEQKADCWQTIVGGKINIGDKIFFAENLEAEILEKNGKECIVRFNLKIDIFWQVLDKIGHMPVPPYIKNSELSEKDLRREYQTVYAQNYGSAAAPTAGLHFTKKLMGELELNGVKFASIDLHVGLGTFSPIEEEDIKKKKLHLENFSVPFSTVEKIISAKKSGGRIISVGTTTVRALESAADEILLNKKNISGATDIFIQPGDKFQIVDGLITNFHLPKSSLMMLVAAFIESKTDLDGREKLLELYNHAIDNNYRYYSFGDAMLIA